MKKIFILLLLLLPIKVMASGVTISTTNLTIEQGKNAVFTITGSDCAGRVDITSANSSIANVNSNSVWLDNNTSSITVTGALVGNTNIIVNLIDVASGDLKSITGTYNVNVNVTKPYVAPQVTPPINNKPQINNTVEKSSDNNLKTLNIKGFNIIKKDNKNYYLEVPKDIINVDIEATPEDSKATVKGIGKHILKIGKNTFNIDVTSVSGTTNTYILTIVRKDTISLSELEKNLLSDKKNSIDVKLQAGDIIDKNILEKIKKSKKEIVFNYINEKNTLLYSWSIKGNDIKDIYDINTKIEINSNFKSKIEKASNYANGLYLNFSHNGKLPNETKIKIFVGDKYKDGDKVNVYYYDEKNDKLNLKYNDVVVLNGYAEFDIKHCSSYLLSKSIITNDVDKKIKENNPIYTVIIIVVGIIISILLGMLLHSKLKEK